MKTLKINFREPNIDRYFEIMAAGCNLGFVFKTHVRDLPKGYNEIIQQIVPDYELSSLQDCDFCIEYPENFYFDQLFNDKIEPIEDVLSRAYKVIEAKEYKLNPIGLQLLKNASERMKLGKDQIQEIIYLAYVISRLDDSNEVKAEHFGEAIQYSKNVSI